MLISSEYREKQRKLHELKPNYGTCGAEYAQQVLELCNRLNTRDVLDYGCGKRELEKALGWEIRNYDPALPGLDADPEPAMVVACTDVLEHIEPDCLDEVLQHIRSKIKPGGIGVLSVCTVPAHKHFPDGTNLHLIIQPMKWWVLRLYQHFNILQFNNLDPNGFFVVKP